MSENSVGKGAMLAVGNGACVGGRVMPGGRVVVAVLLRVASECALDLFASFKLR